MHFLRLFIQLLYDKVRENNIWATWPLLAPSIGNVSPAFLKGPSYSVRLAISCIAGCHASSRAMAQFGMMNEQN